MKILDRYILTTYLKTFISVFLILVLIFILQTIWLYIKELAGKDLDIGVIAKFIIYFLPKLMPLVLPLTILLSSIMVFGSFAENYEFAAMKSTGISLQRAMSGLSIFIVILGITTFFFANNVIPWAELNSLNLRRNITKVKPAMLLVEGQFNEVGNYNIKFAKKHGDTDQFLDDVTIHIKGSDNRTNATAIKSKTGELFGEKDSNVLQLILRDGNYYTDIATKTSKSREKKPFAKSTFQKYIINIDLTELNEVDLDEKSQTDKYSMLNISDLSYAVDSLHLKQNNNIQSFSKNLAQRSGIIKPNTPTPKTNTKENDSTYLGPILNLFDTNKKLQLIDLANRSATSASQIIKNQESTLSTSRILINRHLISLHEKFALGVVCVILFFVGAPLGALIRKGGIGLPMVIAIILFLTYHFIGIFATNSAKSGNFNPILASWFSTLVMLPLSIFLTRRATQDKGLFEFDNIIEPLKKALNIKPKNSINYAFLNTYENNELINTINNYEDSGFDENIRYEAIKILNQRRFDTSDIREQGVTINKAFDTTEKIYKDYAVHSKFAIVLYCIGVLLLVLHFVFANNNLPSLASAALQLSLVSLFLFVIYYIKSIINMVTLSKYLNKKNILPNMVLIVIGFPLYFVTHLLFSSKMKEALKQDCLNSLK
ncbi:MAG: LptF/LptG family permease [Aestuariibaculum sp.]